MKTLRALFWGCIAGAALAYIFAPRRADLLRGANEGGSRQSARTTTATSETQATSTYNTPTTSTANGGMATAATARFIGNTHTRVYHNATDANLPGEENRAYFATTADAEAAGYRPAGQATSV